MSRPESSLVAGNTYRRQFQSASYADCYWRFEGQPWKLVPEAYQSPYTKLTILGNVCGFHIQGDGIVICQEPEIYEGWIHNPHQPGHTPKDRIRVGVKFMSPTNEEFQFDEHPDPRQQDRSLVQITWSSTQKPQIFNASYPRNDEGEPTDPDAAKAALSHQANQHPLAEWAREMPPNTFYEMKLVFRRSLATHQNKRWDWFSTFALLSGWPLFQTVSACVPIKNDLIAGQNKPKALYDRQIKMSVLELAELDEYRPYFRFSRSGNGVYFDKLVLCCTAFVHPIED